MLKLNLGCGKNWREQYPEYEGLDIEDYGQKYVVDVRKFLCGGIPKVQFAEKYDEVMANHFLEHFTQDELKEIISGIWQMLKHDAVFKFVVPHKDREEAWDLTHKTFWNENTAKQLSKDFNFGTWKLINLVTNERKDIHVTLMKI